MANYNQGKKQRRPMPKNPDPLSNAKTMGIEGMKMIRNIAFGNFNFYNEGHVFRNVDFVKNLIMEVDKRLLDASIHVRAIEFAYAGSEDVSVWKLYHRDKKTMEAYTLVRQVLVGIAQTGDTQLLYALMSRLPDYKHNL